MTNTAWRALILFIGAVFCPATSFAECTSRSCTCSNDLRVNRSYSSGRWFVVETMNFQICCEGAEHTANQLARHAETVRAKLTSKWLGETTAAVSPWSPRCQIVLYSNQQSYVSAVGRGSERTVGSSLVKVHNGQVRSRRIDLLGNGNYFSESLPHELTHVILKDRFLRDSFPRWADEGTAMLEDPASKQARHLDDLKEGLATGKTFHAATLFQLDGYPSADRWGVFYGQSASLVNFLVQRKGPERFVKFIEQANATGYDSSLRDYYGIADVAALDREWRLYINSSASRPALLTTKWTKTTD